MEGQTVAADCRSVLNPPHSTPPVGERPGRLPRQESSSLTSETNLEPLSCCGSAMNQELGSGHSPWPTISLLTPPIPEESWVKGLDRCEQQRTEYQTFFLD